MIEPAPPLDWIPDMFRNMVARDEQGVLHRIDWSVEDGRWVPVKEQALIVTA